MKDTGPTYHNFVEYGVFKPFYKICDPNKASVSIGVANFKDAKKTSNKELAP